MTTEKPPEEMTDDELWNEVGQDFVDPSIVPPRSVLVDAVRRKRAGLFVPGKPPGFFELAPPPKHPTLRLFDGYPDTSPELKPAVKELQQLLTEDGLALDVDGFFGRETERAVRAYQHEHEIEIDGIVGPLTWAALLDSFEPEWPTTYAPTDPRRLAERAELGKYEAAVSAAADRYRVPFALLAGSGSGESGWGLRLKPPGPEGTGDFLPRRFPTRFRKGSLPPDGGGFGRGLMQIDYDAHPFARSNGWRDPMANVHYGASVLAEALAWLDGRTQLPPDRLLRAAVAAYNCGAGNVLRAIGEGLDVDYFTAGRDYSKNVFDRAGWFDQHDRAELRKSLNVPPDLKGPWPGLVSNYERKESARGSEPTT